MLSARAIVSPLPATPHRLCQEIQLALPREVSRIQTASHHRGRNSSSSSRSVPLNVLRSFSGQRPFHSGSKPKSSCMPSVERRAHRRAHPLRCTTPPPSLLRRVLSDQLPTQGICISSLLTHNALPQTSACAYFTRVYPSYTFLVR